MLLLGILISTVGIAAAEDDPLCQSKTGLLVNHEQCFDHCVKLSQQAGRCEQQNDEEGLKCSCKELLTKKLKYKVGYTPSNQPPGQVLYFQGSSGTPSGQGGQPIILYSQGTVTGQGYPGSVSGYPGSASGTVISQGYPGSASGTVISQGYPGSVSEYPGTASGQGTIMVQGYPGTVSGQGYPGTVSGQGYPGSVSGQGYPGTVSGQGYPRSVSVQGYPGTVSSQGYPGTVSGQGTITGQYYPGVVSGQGYPGATSGQGQFTVQSLGGGGGPGQIACQGAKTEGQILDISRAIEYPATDGGKYLCIPGHGLYYMPPGFQAKPSYGSTTYGTKGVPSKFSKGPGINIGAKIGLLSAGIGTDGVHLSLGNFLFPERDRDRKSSLQGFGSRGISGAIGLGNLKDKNNPLSTGIGAEIRFHKK